MKTREQIEKKLQELEREKNAAARAVEIAKVQLEQLGNEDSLQYLVKAEKTYQYRLGLVVMSEWVLSND